MLVLVARGRAGSGSSDDDRQGKACSGLLHFCLWSGVCLSASLYFTSSPSGALAGLGQVPFIVLPNVAYTPEHTTERAMSEAEADALVREFWQLAHVGPADVPAICVKGQYGSSIAPECLAQEWSAVGTFPDAKY